MPTEKELLNELSGMRDKIYSLGSQFEANRNNHLEYVTAWINIFTLNKELRDGNNRYNISGNVKNKLLENTELFSNYFNREYKNKLIQTNMDSALNTFDINLLKQLKEKYARALQVCKDTEHAQDFLEYFNKIVENFNKRVDDKIANASKVNIPKDVLLNELSVMRDKIYSLGSQFEANRNNHLEYVTAWINIFTLNKELRDGNKKYFDDLREKHMGNHKLLTQYINKERENKLIQTNMDSALNTFDINLLKQLKEKYARALQVCKDTQYAQDFLEYFNKIVENFNKRVDEKIANASKVTTPSNTQSCQNCKQNTKEPGANFCHNCGKPF